MAKKIAELLIKLAADTLGIEKMSYDVRKQLKSLQKDLTSFGKSWSLYVTAPLTATAAVSVKAADVQLKNEQRLLTALRGREDIQQRLIRQAGELQSRSLFGDEEIIGQQAFLASLGLTEQQINDTIEAAAQLSSATGMTLDSAVKNLAKTYGGLSGELGESIPKLKELTVEQMKNGEAVKFILENYKGFAESAAETGLGPLQQLKNSIGDVGEEIGKVLMPMVQAVANVLKDFAGWLQGLPPTAKTVTVVIGGLAASLGPLSIGLGSIIKMLPAVKAGLASLAGPLGAIAAMVSIIYLAYSDVQGQIKSLADSDSLEGLERRLEANRAKQQKIVDETTRKRLVVRGSGAAFNMFSIEDAPDRSQLKDLYAEESLLVRAIEQKKQMLEDEARAQDEANQAMEQARIQAEEWLKTINTTSADSNKASGLIGELTDKISKLEEAKTKAASTSEIHNLALSIAELRDELERLQTIGNSESIAGDTGNLFGKGITPLKFDPNAINPPESDWTEARQNFAANLSNFVAEAQGLVLNAMPAIRNLFTNVATSIGEGLGDIFSGDGTFNDLLGGIVKVMGQFLKALGQQLIDLGFEMLAIKETLAAIFNNPWAAITVGIAAIAAGQAMINSFNKRNEGGVALAEGGLAYGPTMALVGDNRGAGSDPEVIAPLSKLRQYGLGRQTIEFVGGTFRLSGSDLVLAISREQAKINYVNALA
ncbi:hypothetical protein [Alistipes sp. An66]|uniref:hypothetical protein n=1 Tax=Alistipes sp. An66 TaxID=1965650 RepID=UPI000B5632F4|nr:hypothetical protein [Alistipes sp. An66]OUN59604.1 hypothetical protein B5G16_04605 [Alistipes sp. An66]